MKKAMTACDLSDVATRQSHSLRSRGDMGDVAPLSVGRRISPLIVCAVLALVGCNDKREAETTHAADSVLEADPNSHSEANADALSATTDARVSTSPPANADVPAPQAAATHAETASSHAKSVASQEKGDTPSDKASASNAESGATHATGATGDMKAGTASATSDPVPGQALVDRGAAVLDQAGKGAVSLVEGGGALLGRIGGRLREEDARGAAGTSDAHPGAVPSAGVSGEGATRRATDDPSRGNAAAAKEGAAAAAADAPATTVAIHFGFDATTFSSMQARSLDSIVATLVLNPARHAIVAGHTDRHGAVAYNRALARARAEAVRDHLLGRGVAAAQLTVRGDAGNDAPERLTDGAARRVDVMLRAAGEPG